MKNSNLIDSIYLKRFAKTYAKVEELFKLQKVLLKTIADTYNDTHNIFIDDNTSPGSVQPNFNDALKHIYFNLRVAQLQTLFNGNVFFVNSDNKIDIHPVIPTNILDTDNLNPDANKTTGDLHYVYKNDNNEYLTVRTEGAGTYSLTPQKFLDIGNLTLTTGFNIIDGELNFVGSFAKVDKSSVGTKEVIAGAVTTPIFYNDGILSSQYIPGGGGGSFTLTGAKMLAQANATNFKLSNEKLDINDNILTNTIFSPEPTEGTEYVIYQRANKSYTKIIAGSGSVTAENIYSKFKPGQLIITGILNKKLEIDTSNFMLTSLLSPKPTTTPNLVLLGYVDGGVLKCGANITPTPASPSREGKFTRGSQLSVDNVSLNWSNNKSIIPLTLHVPNSLTHAKTIDPTIPTPTYANLLTWINGTTHTCYLEVIIQHVGSGNNRLQIAKTIGTGTALSSYAGQGSHLNGGIYFNGSTQIGYNARTTDSLNIQNVNLDWIYYLSKSGLEQFTIWRKPTNADHFVNDLMIDKFLFTMVTVKH